MSKSSERQLDEQQRLLAMREFLHVRAKPEDPDFDAQIVEAAIRPVRSLIDRNARLPGEQIIAAIAQHVGVRFEDVRNPADIHALEQKYLVGQKELGFGLLAKELADPTVDALLIQRMNATTEDRWVAVVNLQATEARAYWSRPHEIVHRLAEPPQRRLPFFRHRSDFESRVERIMDLGAAELAFPQSVYGPLVHIVGNRELTWDVVSDVRARFAPTSSWLSAAKAFLRHWPRPAFLLEASVRGRLNRPSEGVALRVSLEGFSPIALRSGVQFFSNMRVPQSSPLWTAHSQRRSITDHEDLRHWTTSGGSALPGRRALSSALSLRGVVYGLVSLV